MNDRQSEHTLPPDRFYWGVLDTSRLPQAIGRRRREQLDALFETVLPVPIESVHATYTPAGNTGKSTILACAASVETLRPLGADPHATSLSPESIPPEVLASLPEGSHDPASINLLTGQYAPIRVRAARWRALTVAAASVLVAAALFVYGAESRVVAYRDNAAHARAQIAEIHARVLPPAARPGPRHHEFLGELRRVQRAASSPKPPTDAADTLATLLASWPLQPPAQTRSLVVAPGTITVETSCQTSEDAQALVAAIAPPEGWSLSPQNIRRGRDRVDVTLRLTQLAEGGRP